MKKYLSMLLVVVMLATNTVNVSAMVQTRYSNAGGNRTYAGSRYYYHILANKSYGTQRQAIYNLLAAKAEELHSDFTTNYTGQVYMTINLEDYFTRNAFNYFDLDVYEAADETIAAFFDDNTQYCFLEKNVGVASNSWVYNVNFYQPQTTAEYPSLDLRLAADRRTMRDMMDETFSTYETLTENAQSKYEIARLVHDKIVSDWDYSSGNILPFSPGSHDLLGGMGLASDGIVCEAYSKMYAFLLNNLGVPAIFVGGDMLATEGFAAGGHAWNIVEMDDGKYYFADLTWADNQRTSQDVGNYRNPINYSWFLLGIDNGKFESRHYAGEGSFIGVYERPANMGGPDYAYETIYTDYTFLTDLPADRSMGYDLGTYHMPSGGQLSIQPSYFDTDLEYGTDYEIRFETPLHTGKNRVWFVGKGAFRGMDFGYVHIVDENVSLDLDIQLPSQTYEYTGSEVRPVPVVKNGMISLRSGVDYTVSYEDNVERGAAKVIITGLGIYAGIYEQSFQIISLSNGTHMTGAEFSQIYPNIENALVVISKNDGSRISQNFHNDALPQIQNAANYYGLPVYYIDYYEEDPSAYDFFQDMEEEFYRSGQYTNIESYPLLGIYKDADSFGVYAAEAMTADSGYYYFPFMFEDEIRAEIEKYIQSEDDGEDEPVYGISLNPSSHYSFGTVNEDYGSQSACSVTISNTGNQDTGSLNIGFSGGDSSAFVLNKSMTGNIAVNGSDQFTVAPRSGLAAGIYSAIVTVSGGNAIYASLTVSFQVEQNTNTSVFPISIKAVQTDSQFTYGTWMKGNLSTALAPCTWKGDSSSAMPKLYENTVSLDTEGKYYFVLAGAGRWSLDGTCKAIEVTVDANGHVGVQGYNIMGNTISTTNQDGKISYDPSYPTELMVSWGSIPAGNVEGVPWN